MVLRQRFWILLTAAQVAGVMATWHHRLSDTGSSAGCFLSPCAPASSTPSTPHHYRHHHKDRRHPTQPKGSCLYVSDDEKWASDGVNDYAQRFESVKAAVISGLAGSVASVPAGLLADWLVLGSLPQWEYNTDMLALESALFGIVYRYAVREDRNPQLKNGVVGAFALTRALTMVKVSSACMAVPLRCGAPIGYLNWDMLLALGAGLATSFVAFGASSRALEFAFERGWLSKFPSR